MNTFANAQATDWTRVTLDKGTFSCTNVGVKHYAKPAGGPAYWTEEDTSVWIAQTETRPELLNRSWRTF